ncbi:MAG: hypothetical protein ABI869_02060 [Actinomycetota bacterium]
MSVCGRRLGARAIAVASLFVAVLPTCSHQTAVGTTVDIRVRDFAIEASRSVIAHGPIDLRVNNRGPSTHEFVVVRTDLRADRLPIGPDGLSVDEDALATVGEIQDVPIWTTRLLELSLAPGRYVFFCNLEGHYLGGMHTSIVVSR